MTTTAVITRGYIVLSYFLPVYIFRPSTCSLSLLKSLYPHCSDEKHSLLVYLFTSHQSLFAKHIDEKVQKHKRKAKRMFFQWQRRRREI